MCNDFMENLTFHTREIPRELWKVGSLSAKVYFLLLQKPRTITELSRILYSGRIQLSALEGKITDFEKLGIIKRADPLREELKSKNEDARSRYWKAEYWPLIAYFESKLDFREQVRIGKIKPKGLWNQYEAHKTDALDKHIGQIGLQLTAEDEKVLQMMLESKWFNGFLTGEYAEYELGRDASTILELQEEKEREKKHAKTKKAKEKGSKEEDDFDDEDDEDEWDEDEEDEERMDSLTPFQMRELSKKLGEFGGGAIVYPNPLEALARIAEELGAIRYAFSSVKLKGIYCSNQDILKATNWDAFIQERASTLNGKEKEKVDMVLKRAKVLLGEGWYESINQYDIIFNNYGPLFIPLDLANKLMRVGRIPMTIYLAFERAAQWKGTMKKFMHWYG
jgi:hypothetical protein